MASKQTKFFFKLFVKLALTAAALFFVYKKIDIPEFLEAVSSIKPLYYALAVVAFNLSKIVAAFRLNHFYKSAGLELDAKTNLKLYYVGMFYNLFLPGAISGDAYKIYMLKQAGVEAKTKSLVSATFLDRVSGMAFLTILGLIFLMFSSFVQNNSVYFIIAGGLAVLVLPGYYLFIKLFFKNYLDKFWVTNWLSLVVQAGQVLSAWFLFTALGETNLLMEYLALFMISSVVSIIPTFPGGAGARELVFYYGFNYLRINEAVSVAFASLFFGITAITALIGLFFVYFIDKNIAVNPSTESTEES